MPPNAARSVTLVLTTREGGELLGSLPPFDVPLPWWQEVSGFVAGARSAYSVDVTVLRLLSTSRPFGEGGPVAYLAETSSPVSGLATWDGPDPLADEPLRLAYARPGGPDADLVWAEAALTARGSRLTAAAAQQRTWNLSSVWRLQTTEGTAWLKVVPPFLAHEGSMLRLIGAVHPDLVPPLWAEEGPRVLLGHVAGGDNYDAGPKLHLAMIRSLVPLQAEWAGRVHELLALGGADWRAEALVTDVRRLLDRTADQLDAATLDVLRRFVDDLPGRLTAVAECGVPDTLVHGDFHPGNTVGPAPVILDWGDAGAGNAMLDRAALTARVDATDRRALMAEWARLWEEHVPGADAARAADLLEPVAPVRQALVYRSFLDQIEPSERVYHASDPAERLRRVAAVYQERG
ncbi:MAG: hypothetical protein QOE01_3224 [Actinomycetota bacterium]|nr:hypothetical protein [Actinomycetota bacterium]